jgi:hypothetical protein
MPTPSLGVTVGLKADFAFPINNPEGGWQQHSTQQQQLQQAPLPQSGPTPVPVGTSWPRAIIKGPVKPPMKPFLWSLNGCLLAAAEILAMTVGRVSSMPMYVLAAGKVELRKKSGEQQATP